MRTTDLDRAAAAALWYRELRETSNERFMPLYFDEHRYLVLMGGGGSGKSIFAGRKLLERAVTEPGHRFLVCRKVGRTIRDSCFRQLCGQLADYYPDTGYRIKHSDLRISFPNGSEILFSGLDDVEKLKSIYNITGIWIEEASELEEQDFNQLDIRLRGETDYYKQIIISFNPVSALHWLKKRFFDTPDERALTHRSTYRDNRFLDSEAIRTLEGFRDTDPYYYAVYCLGEWGVTGKTIFQASRVQARLAQIERQGIRPDTGIFAFAYDGLRIRDVRWEAAEDGYVQIYRAPEDGVPYVIGADTAGEGSDFFVAQVLDNRTGEQVAVMRTDHIDEDVFARQLYALGAWYHFALIGVETNFSTYTVRELERLRYPRQYVRETEDSYTHKPKTAYGFRTDPRTRPAAIAELVAFVRDHTELFHDRATLEEMLTFVRSESGRPEAESGAHDDCILALAIAHRIRGQQRTTRETPEAERVVWTADMWDDWRRADAAERRYLEEKWGKPKRGKNF